MIKSFKVQLKPSNKQATYLHRCASVASWAYNWTLGKQQENYKSGGKFLTLFTLQKELTLLKKEPEFAWLNLFKL